MASKVNDKSIQTELGTINQRHPFQHTFLRYELRSYRRLIYMESLKVK